jgi:hypothetical protein
VLAGGRCDPAAGARRKALCNPLGKGLTSTIIGQKLSTTSWFVAGIGIAKQTLELGQVKIVLELEKFETAEK